VRAFREELQALESEGAVTLTPAQRASIAAHHDTILDSLAERFEVDRTEEQKRLSLGMRIVSALGAFALAAAAYYFFYRFWGGMPPQAQAGILAAAPLAALAGMEISARRERTLYVTGLLGILAAAFFVIDISVLTAWFNVPLSPLAMLAWSAFCWCLAYAWGLRLLLIGSILSLFGFVATISGAAEPCVWHGFGHRPENFLPLGLFLCAMPLVAPHRAIPSFARIYRAAGLLSFFGPLLLLASSGHASYLRLPPGAIEAAYQLAGFALAGVTIWLGIRWGMSEATNIGGGFFVVLLYVKFFEWWWDWMPKWVFFLVLGIVAVALLVVLRKLRALTRRAGA
jgi:hypothetical protein